MKNRNQIKIFLIFLSYGLLIFIFRGVIFNSSYYSGDVGLFDWSIDTKTIIPFIWESGRNVGFSNFPYLWLHFLSSVPLILINKLGLNFDTGIKIFYIIPIFILPLVYLFKFKFNSVYLLGLIIYFCNTFFLMIIGGGQVGVALAYGFTPILIFLFSGLFRVLIDRNNIYHKVFLKKSLELGIILSVLIGLDIRIAYICLFLAVFFLVYFLIKDSEFRNLKSLVFRIISYLFFIPLMVGFLLNSYWLIPGLLFRISPTETLTTVYTSFAAVQYFSFADFVHTISLLHPNWPENIFGKTFFMQPEFLIIPLVAFSSLLFIQNKFKSGINHKHPLVFFSLLALVGAFLAKGSNPPYGELYLWMFDHIPGFVMFRDPTKWYLLIALSYAVLIPFSLENISKWISERVFKNFKFKFTHIDINFIIGVIFICFWLFTVREAVLGQLGGIFKEHPIPLEYNKLVKLISGDHEYFRTFWIPNVQRFGYTSSIHPAMDSLNMTNSASISGVLSWLANGTNQNQLVRWGVKYVIVPDDSLGEIFVSDRKYDNKIYLETVNAVRKITGLTELPGWEKLKVFEMKNYYHKFWINDSLGSNIYFVTHNPTQYSISLSPINYESQLIFSESFDRYWIGRIGNKVIRSQVTPDKLNSFLIPANTTNITIEYEPQKMVNFGLIISYISFVSIIGLLVTLGKKIKV
jgi:hypothetical protein